MKPSINKMRTTVLELLYRSYEEQTGFDQESVQGGFECLNEILTSAAVPNAEMVIEIVCDLCSESQKIGFTAGVKAGFDLSRELT